MDDLGYGLAWRVLDAQFFGVAQRRRRVFLVGHLGDKRAAEVLFERESLRWDSASSREKRKALTRRPESSARSTSAFLPNNGTKARSLGISDELSPTLKTEHNPAVYQIAGNIIGRGDMNGGHQLGVVDPDEDGAFTLTTTDRHAVAFAQNQRDEVHDLHDCAGALAAQPGIKQQTYVFSAQNAAQAGLSLAEDTSPTLSTSKVPATLQIRGGKAGGGKGALVAEEMSATLITGVQQTLFPGNGTVRRLTPVECERLQGFEDGYTDIPYRGKPHSPDSARYKALGNSMCTHVMQWIGDGIRKVQEGSHE